MHPFASKLLQWYSVNARSLPWRDCGNAYAIWLSEIILQQTRISQGTAYWQRFMQRFPTVESLAAASEDEVLRLWQGLGYYSRARHLHEAARQIVAMQHMPRTYNEWLTISGVGPYTAAAIASAAYGEPVPAIDGNANRVLARCFGVTQAVNTAAGSHQIGEIARQVLPPHYAADFNQALMDFGSLQCVPQSPQCSQCVMSSLCMALQQNMVDQLPAKKSTVKVKPMTMVYVYLRYQGKTAIRRRPAGGIWQGLYEPLLLGQIGDLPACDGTLTQIAKGVNHVLTHRVITADFYLLDLNEPMALPQNYFWVAETELDRYAKPRLIERLLQMLP